MTGMLGGTVDGVLPFLREQAESLMNCACTISNPAPPDAAPSFDAETGLSGRADPAPVYTGQCRVRKPTLAEQTSTSGEFQWTLQDSVLSIPMAATGVNVGHQVLITASASDPDLPDKRYEIVGVLRGSQATARRLIIREA